MTSIEDQPCMSFDKFYYNYARFHDNWLNKIIHIVWIPIITWTLGVFLALVPGTYGNLPYVAATTLTIIYLMIRLNTGIVWIFIAFPGAYLAKLAATNRDLQIAGYTILHLCIILQITGWIFQFIGHGLFESKSLCFNLTLTFLLERAPAIVSNLLFLFIAPFFFVIEVE